MKVITKERVHEESHYVSDLSGKPCVCRIELSGGYGSHVADMEKFVFDVTDDEARKFLQFMKRQLPKRKKLENFLQEAW